jgi:two-component system phosphate regulon response regulator OmpR
MARSVAARAIEVSDTGQAGSGETARHILVVDDDNRLRRLLQRYLAEHGYHVTTAADANEAKAALKNFAFDMMVLDVMMPGQNGISLTGELRNRFDLPILLLTALGESDDRVHGLSAGADDYLVKPFDPRELLLRIATILRRAAPPLPSRAPLRFGPFTFDPEKAILWRGDQRVHLTDAELSLLQVLAEQPGLPVSRQDLGRRGRVSGSDRAIDTQIARLRRKLEPDSRRPHHLLTKRGEGYVLKPGS